MVGVWCRGPAAAMVVVCAASLGGCAMADDELASARQEIGCPQQSAVERGREIWFENTYGGEKFFRFLANHPDPQRRIVVGFEDVLQTPRAQRFDVWGVLNDPDCEANPAGGLDLCPDPGATGVIGIRQTPGAGGEPLYGVTCASCHAGFDPLDPPDDPNEPTWDEIHPTIGNQHLRSGAIFAANLASGDPRALLFHSWPDGTVDTSLLFDDHIRNPGTITAIWEVERRPTFDVGLPDEKIRSGQGGEDDLGGDVAALRVYTNIGVCFQECVAGPAAAGVPIDAQTCRETCPDLPPQEDLDDLVSFLESIRSPRYPARHEKEGPLYAAGRRVFDEHCASCHDRGGKRHRLLSSDEVVPLAADPANAPNACRALGSNWEEGRIWAQFSSQVYKDRVAAGDRGYRVMPLTGIWATAPFLHNQSIGDYAPAEASPEERAAVYRDAMHELLSPTRVPVVHTIPVAIGPFPAGTPATVVFSRDPSTGALLCNDPIENRGHHYGSDLPPAKKEALIHWLLFQ